MPRSKGLTQKEKKKLQKFVRSGMTFYGLTRSDVALGEFPRRLNPRYGGKNDLAYRQSVLNRLFTDSDSLSRGTAHAIGIMLLSCPGAELWRTKNELPSLSEYRKLNTEAQQDGSVFLSIDDTPFLSWHELVSDVFPDMTWLHCATSESRTFPPMLLPAASVERCARWMEYETQLKSRSGRKKSLSERLAKEAESRTPTVAEALSVEIAIALVGLNLRGWGRMLALYLDEASKDADGQSIPAAKYQSFRTMQPIIYSAILEYCRGEAA
jgi:hypothetical protein